MNKVYAKGVCSLTLTLGEGISSDMKSANACTFVAALGMY